MRLVSLGVMGVWPGAAIAGEGAPEVKPADFARELVVPVLSAQPHDVPLPETIYRTLTRLDRGDLCVFDEQGTRVPFAFVTETSEHHSTRSAAPTFRVASERERDGEHNLWIVRADGGALVLREGKAPPVMAERAEILIDLGANRAQTSLELDWEVPGGDRLWEVEFATSNDLVEFHSVRRQAIGAVGPEQLKTLLDAAGTARYLRLRTAAGFPPTVQLRRAELVKKEVLSPAPGHVRVSGVRGRTPLVYQFRLEGAFPWTQVSLGLRAPNARVEGALFALTKDGDSGSVISEGTFGGASAPARAAVPAGTTLLEVRLLDKGSATTAEPEVDLEYTQLLLRFLPHGVAPHRVAFGSAHARCEGMSSLASEQQSVRVTAPATYRELAGEAARRPTTDTPKSRRAWIVWAALGSAVLFFSWVALRLVRDLRKSS